jgi:hypothetical protein
MYLGYVRFMSNITLVNVNRIVTKRFHIPIVCNDFAMLLVEHLPWNYRTQAHFISKAEVD